MAVAPRRSPRRPWGTLLLLAILVAALGWVLYLRLTNQPLRDPFGIYDPAPVVPAPDGPQGLAAIEPPADGMVRALISARDISAYNKVTRDDLFDSRRGAFAFMDLDEQFAEDNGIYIGVGDILGRVMKRPKRPGYAFTEADFLPKGTRPGLVAGIPANKRALRIDVDLVRGIIGLNPGDRFDLIATRTIEPAPSVELAAARSKGASPAVLGAYADLVPNQGDTRPRARRSPGATAKVETIVNGGIVVSPLTTRLVPTSSASLTSGQINGTRPVQEMVIALAPEEVAPLTASLRLEADLTCVARSGHPDDEYDSVTPGLVQEPESDDEEDEAEDRARAMQPLYPEIGQLKMVETIVGGVRTLTVVPQAPESASAESDAGDVDGEGR